MPTRSSTSQREAKASEQADPLRDEGVDFYRLLLEAGVAAQCPTVMVTSHGMDVFTAVLPDISRETAASVARFASA